MKNAIVAPGKPTEELSPLLEEENKNKHNQQNSGGRTLYTIKGREARIAVPAFDGLQMINVDDIVKCIAHESYTEIVLICGTKFMVSRNLKEYEAILAPFCFFRIHNSCLVNLRHVKKYVRGEGGYLIMSDGQSCEVSRRKKTELLNRLLIVEL
jgi:two-component system, LytTR family, response regulator